MLTKYVRPTDPVLRKQRAALQAQLQRKGSEQLIDDAFTSPRQAGRHFNST